MSKADSSRRPRSDGRVSESGRPEPTDALRWITRLLGERGTPYQIVGGVAARAYGACRPLVDIDLYVPDAATLDAVASAAASHLRMAPRRHRDVHWDLTFLQLHHRGWTVELAAASSARVWDRRVQSWQPAVIRFEKGEKATVAGVALRVMPRPQLVDYKNGLARDVDLVDLVELGAIINPVRRPATVERRSSGLPSFVTIPEADAGSLGLTDTSIVEVAIDDHILGRRSLKPWGVGRNAWFFDLTRTQAEAADVDTGDAVVVEIRRADETLPRALFGLLQESRDATEAWASLTPARRRMIAETVRSAKRVATRERRARKLLLER